MKPFLAILFFFTWTTGACNKEEFGRTMISNPVIEKKYTYLAIGDSYTIGESVPATGNFPNQVVSSLLNNAIPFLPARIIAKTGWTTDELETGILTANNTIPLLPSYDFVSLLIGVNNQYRGRSVDNYNQEFEELLRKAIRYAGDKADRVIVLSIPDWGVTPFANGRDRAQIAIEIDAYNAANKQIAQQYNVQYLNITPWAREAATDNSLLATDGLHPSGKEYQRWAESISTWIKSKL
jgi:lysophospholipase L1-like esterase